MASLKTSNGLFQYKQHLLFLEDHNINVDTMVENLRTITPYFDNIGINWGPAFGTLIGIIRNNRILPWAHVFNIYILKEDEERFKDQLWTLSTAGFRLIRYERRGLYYLERNGEFFKIFVLHKISPDIRHTGGTDFIHEKYLQNTTKWFFKGISLNVPTELDNYLTFQYGNWIVPQPKAHRNSSYYKYTYWIKNWILDHLPDVLYYDWLKRHRKSDLIRFKKLCQEKGCPLPENVELSNLKPRKYQRVLTVGVYDLIHKGHVELYRKAKALGDYLIVAVQDSEYILKYKPQSKILNSTEDRVYMVKSIKYVDETLIYTDVDKIVQTIPFDIFVTGPDQNHPGFKKAIAWCEANGKNHVVLGRTAGVSSTQLKEKIAEKTKKHTDL